MTIREGSDNIFEDLGFTGEEAANLKMRAELLIRLREIVRQWKVSQADAARRLGVTQPDVSALMTGKIVKFSIDKLIGLLERAGQSVEVKFPRRRKIQAPNPTLQP